MAQVNDLVIHCIDFRFQEPMADWIKAKIGPADRVALAGASKALLDKAASPVVLTQLQIARDLHGITTVHIIDHIDCGAYGGSKEHPNQEAEVAMHRDRLKEATQIIADHLPELTVKSYIADFDSISTL